MMKTPYNPLIWIGGISSISLFIVLFLPALMSDIFQMDYRFAHHFTGSDFAFYYNSSLLRFDGLESDQTEQIKMALAGVPQEFFTHVYAAYPLVDEIFYPFTSLPFRDAYQLFLFLMVGFLSVTVIFLYRRDMLYALLFLGVVLCSYPMLGSMEKGQISLFLIPMMMLFFVALERKSLLLALIILGIIVHIKIFPLYMFLFFVLYLLLQKEYKPVAIGVLLALIWLSFNYAGYLQFFEHVDRAAATWSLKGGVINHSIFSFDYFFSQKSGFSIEIPIKLAVWSGFLFLLYMAWKRKQISHHAWLYLVAFSSVLPYTSYFYNLIIFFAFVPMLDKSDWKYPCLLALIVAYPLHLGFKGAIPDVILGLVSIKFPLLFALMALSLWREYTEYQYEKSNGYG